MSKVGTHLTPEARRKQSERMKALWANRKQASNANNKPTNGVAPVPIDDAVGVLVDQLFARRAYLQARIDELRACEEEKKRIDELLNRFSEHKDEREAVSA